MQANKYPSNFEGWYLLEKMKEQQEMVKSKFPIEEVDDLEVSFEIEKEPVDYMCSVPLTFADEPKMQSENTTASSGSDNDTVKQYVSPKASISEQQLLEKHHGQPKPECKSEFIKYYFDKMKEKHKGDSYNKKVKNLVKMLKQKKGKF
jgi:hypothetical protein